MGRRRALVGIGFRRVIGRLQSADARRVVLAICGVVLAIALMVTVTGVALELASGSTVRSEDVDYWIVPEGGSVSSVAVSVEGPQLGSVHSVAEQLSRQERIDYATPIQMRILEVRAGDTQEYILALGVVAPPESRTVAGLPTTGLTPGDPHYANGTYNGTWTGETIVSDSAGQLLGVPQGGSMQIVTGGTNRTLTATQVVESDLSSGLGPTPVVLMHLAELQSVTGAASGDQADQILVSTNAPGVKADLENVYPRTQVMTRGGIGAESVSLESLPIAVAVTALLAALVVGILFVATMMGLEVTADRQNIATLATLGYSAGSQTLLVMVETLVVTLIGGVGGVVVGIGGIAVVNRLTVQFIGVEAARFHPLLLGYGLVVGLVIGLVAAPYPIWLTRRTDVLEVLNR